MVLVDDEDYARVLGAGPWHVKKGTATCYAIRNIRNDGKHRMEFLHRFLMKECLYPGVEIDHVSGNGLDCRRENMRVVTRGENLQNVQRDTTNRRKPKTSRFRGVCWDKDRRRWAADVMLNGRHFHLGRFIDETKAANAAADARAQHLRFVNENRHRVCVP